MKIVRFYSDTCELCSDSDKKCADNFGIDYIDVRDFIND